MNILIKNCYIFLGDSETPIVQGDVAIEGNTIVKVGNEGSISQNWQPEKVIDGSNYLCLPGFINCHTHAAMTLLRSYADDLPLMDWLEKKIWPIENRLKGEDVYWGSLLAMVEMIKSGTTTFNDMYFFMDEVAQAAKDIGIRACLSRGLIGIGGSAEVGIEESKELFEKWQGGAEGRIRVWFGPHAPYTCPPEYLKRVVALAKEYRTGIHIHVAETRDEVRIIREQYSKTPVAYLDDLGVFELPVVAAHCVHLTDEDISILARRKVAVAHNPESNMKLASGIAPIARLRMAGVTVGIGTDGTASNNNLDMFGEMRTAALVQKAFNENPSVLPALDVLKMATSEGAKALGMGDVIGSLKPGYKADLILVNIHKPHFYPRHNLVAHVVYAAEAGDVDAVIIDGKIIMEDRRILTIDEERVLEEVARCSHRLTSGVE
ncbi:MAG: amidohydrolase [Thermacetogeniaceae bacterium]